MREEVLEFLLINHPLDCPICDQAGECKPGVFRPIRPSGESICRGEGPQAQTRRPGSSHRLG
ncbi:MAG: hypothetical protein U1G07_13755 [Verrucomicrobiota bacterium]